MKVHANMTMEALHNLPAINKQPFGVVIGKVLSPGFTVAMSSPSSNS
jgi:hypothetical protein